MKDDIKRFAEYKRDEEYAIIQRNKLQSPVQRILNQKIKITDVIFVVLLFIVVLYLLIGFLVW